MDPNASLLSTIVDHLTSSGVLVLASTAAGGFLLGPEGIAIGASAGGAAASAISVLASPAYRRYACNFGAFLLRVLPHIVTNEYIQNFLRRLADLIARLLRQVGLLPASELRYAVAPHDHEPRPPPTH